MNEREIQNKPLVSIIMCVYNGLPYIKDAVDSILNQTYENWELIISDDASVDGTSTWLKDVLGSNGKIRLFYQSKNLGYVLNKNFAHKKAKGLYITQQDSDDLSTPNRIDEMMRVILRDPELKIVGSGYKKVDKNANFLSAVSGKEDTVLTTSSDGDFPFWFPGLLVHNEVFNRLGYFNEYFSGVYGDDLYWTIRAIEHYPIYCLKEPLYIYRNNPNSLTNSFDLRKLIIPIVVGRLIEQRRVSGTDWLQQRNWEALTELEKDLKENKILIAEQLRVWAAKAIDQKDKTQALNLLWRAFRYNPFNPTIFRTFLYYLRSKS